MIDFKLPQIINIEGEILTSGQLRFLECSEDLPFEIKRVFWITDVPEKGLRGIHAHKKEAQILIALRGTLEIRLEDKSGQKFRFSIDHPSHGLILPPMHWSEVEFSNQAVLLGLGNRAFAESDYIRNKQDFDRI